MATAITRPFKGRAVGLSQAGDLVANHSTGQRMLTDLSSASVGTKNGSTVSVVEYGNGVFNKTVFTFTATPITLADSTQGGGVKIYDFPAGRIFTMGATGSIAMTTTSTLASTLNTGVTCNWGLGTTVQANGTLATTEQNILQTTNITASATINVAGAASGGSGLAVVTSLNGTSTAIDLYLNVGVASATDIDGDATVTITGTATVIWYNGGDY